MLPTVIVSLIMEFHDEFGQVSKRIDLNRLVRYAYSEWLFSKNRTEKECKNDIWTNNESEWLHFLGVFLMYDYNFNREKIDLKRMFVNNYK